MKQLKIVLALSAMALAFASVQADEQYGTLRSLKHSVFGKSEATQRREAAAEFQREQETEAQSVQRRNQPTGGWKALR